MIQAVVFDVDGVLSTHEQSFSRLYADQHHMDYGPFRAFFQGEFQQALVGNADLKQLIQNHPELWSDKDVDHLLDTWFSYETNLNQSLLEAAQTLKDKGFHCYIATNQELYRGEYIRDIMLPVKFNNYFISGFVGAKKPEEQFFRHLIDSVTEDIPTIKPEEILFIDDSPEHIEGAAKLGINAHLHTDTRATQQLLASI